MNRRRPKIRTQCICPPIPDRSRDWRAWYDGEEESGCYGEGATEEDAIADLCAGWPRTPNDREYEQEIEAERWER